MRRRSLHRRTTNHPPAAQPSQLPCRVLVVQDRRSGVCCPLPRCVPFTCKCAMSCAGACHGNMRVYNLTRGQHSLAAKSRESNKSSTSWHIQTITQPYPPTHTHTHTLKAAKHGKAPCPSSDRLPAYATPAAAASATPAGIECCPNCCPAASSARLAALRKFAPAPLLAAAPLPATCKQCLACLVWTLPAHDARCDLGSQWHGDATERRGAHKWHGVGVGGCLDAPHTAHNSRVSERATAPTPASMQQHTPGCTPPPPPGRHSHRT
jgi:hypothetical protein